MLRVLEIVEARETVAARVEIGDDLGGQWRLGTAAREGELEVEASDGAAMDRRGLGRGICHGNVYSGRLCQREGGGGHAKHGRQAKPVKESAFMHRITAAHGSAVGSGQTGAGVCCWKPCA